MTASVRAAMILGAGLGLRMRPLTETRPKPLLPIAGRAIIDRLIDKLVAAGITRVVVNVHWLADQMRDHLAARRDVEIILSDETDGLRDSGGGVVKALPQLGDDPFLVLNGDSVWVDTLRPTLPRLIRAFDPAAMDCLLLLASTVLSVGYEGAGDYDLKSDGRARRRHPSHQAAFVYAGVFVATPALFKDWEAFATGPLGAFSLNRLWDRAQEADRLYGLRHDGPWLHAGTPEGLREIEAFLDRY